MKRIVGMVLLVVFLLLAVSAVAEVVQIPLNRMGDDKERAVALEAGRFYLISDIYPEEGWFSFTATTTGIHTFSFTLLTSKGVSGSLRMYDKHGTEMWKGDYNSRRERTFVTADLVAGETYTLKALIFDNYTYTLFICSPSQHVSLGEAQLRKAATCEEDGYMAQICEYCGGEGPHLVIPATGHQSGGMQTVLPATCVQTGLDADVCLLCGEALGYVSTPALGHTSGGVRTVKEATCVEEGITEEFCAGCGTILQTIVTPVGEHTAGAWTSVRAATCTAEGYRVQQCTGCGKTLDSETVAAYGHSVSEWKEESACCTIPGKRYRECSTCGAELERETIPATGHAFSAWTEVIAPTTKATGLEKRECLSCGEQETRTVEKLTFLQGIFGR